MSDQTTGDSGSPSAAEPGGASGGGVNESDLIKHVAGLHEEEVLAVVQQRLASGEDPLSVVGECQSGMQRVGERYEQGEYYLAGLIMAGEILREVMELAQPFIEAQIRGEESGRVLIGTVQGDIHDIGKNIQAMLLTCYGFSVSDLGVDVPPETFLSQAEELHPHIIGLSGLLTSSYDTMRDTISLLRNAAAPGLGTTPIVIGGNCINEQVCKYVDADHWITNAMEGVRLCQRLLADTSASADQADGSTD
jgi:methanogenic corrinoid protein MtbC1